MKRFRNGISRGALVLSVLSSCGTAVLGLATAFCAPAQPSDFYAYYTRLDYDDHNNTGQYADLIVKIGTNGRFVFGREFGYLPYWQPSGTKYFVDRLLPVTGDGPPERPDAINKCCYVRLIESSPDRIVVHWRYAPNLNGPHFTDFQRTYSGDIGSYFADYAEEYFTITADRRITREAKKGCVRLDEWNDPLNKTTQILELTASGIDVQSTTPARLQRRPGDAVPGAPVVKGGVESPALWMRFDEGLSAQDDFTIESVKGSKCRIGGADSYWRKGVSGTCLSFDGYTSRVTVPSRELPNIRGDFTIEAWIAPQEYSWDWSGVVDHGRDKRAGYRLAMDHLGRIALEACLDGRWEGLTTSNAVELLKWTFVTATYRKAKGFAIYLDGVLAACGSATGAVQDAPDLDLFIGMAQEKSYHWACEREITKAFRSNMVFSGLIDEVRVFERALDESEIRSDWLANRFWQRNMVTTHDPKHIFNVDLCGGFPAIIIKMLMTSQPGMIELLPALPKEGASGRIQGLPSRCQVTVTDLQWKPGAVQVVLESKQAQTISLRLPQPIKSISVAKGRAKIASSEKGDQCRKVSLPAGEPVQLVIAL